MISKGQKRILLILLVLLVLDAALVSLLFWKSWQISQSQAGFGSAALPTQPEPTPTPTPAEITLAAVGDIGLVREVDWLVRGKGDVTFPFQKTAKILKEADLAIANLEGPLFEACPLTRTGMIFCGHSQNAAGLSFAGFDLINLSNNHIANYGQAGVQETIQTLAEEEIEYFGLGKVVYKTVDGLKMAFLGFDDVSRRINKEELAAEIKEVRARAKFVVVSFHWGGEYQKTPSPRQEELAFLAIDSGADLIIGHHPHVLQPLEYYQGRPIFYSLGNFVFDQIWSQPTRISVIGLITILEGKVRLVDLVPVKMDNNFQPQLIPEPEKSEIIRGLKQENDGSL